MNLSYDFTKSGLIHFFPKTNTAVTKTEEDLQHLPTVSVSTETTIRLTCTLCHLRIYLDHKLQMRHYANIAIAKGN